MVKVECVIDEWKAEKLGTDAQAVLAIMWDYVCRTSGCDKAKKVSSSVFELYGEDDLMLISAIMDMMLENQKLLPCIKAVPIFVNGEYDDDIKQSVIEGYKDELAV